MAEREAILVEREKTHGDYHKQTYTAQNIKLQMRDTPNWDVMLPAKRESLELIATKIARILHGDCSEPDHWNDIAGYAKLGAEACK